MTKRKICVVTGTRAEYGLLYWLMKEIQADDELELQIIATGQHLSPEFGLTYKNIEADGFAINAKVEMLLSSDSPVGIAKSVGLGTIGFADALARLQPDIMVLLGDRFEALAAAQTAMILRIPIAHIHGGEATEGLIDEAIRHSITKMSLLHFTAAEEYRHRVIQLGEEPSRVYNFGAIGLDNIKRLTLLTRKTLEVETGFKFQRVNFLVTYHPVTLSSKSSEDYVKELLNALDSFEEAGIIFTQANADTSGRIINKIFKDYVNKHQDRMIFVNTLGQLKYLSAIQYMDAVVGNSSSGVLEVPSFNVPTVNIGPRQNGRLMAKSVITCGEKSGEIAKALNKAVSSSFKNGIKKISSPYGSGGVSEKIVNILKTSDLSNERIMKKFYNIEMSCV